MDGFPMYSGTRGPQDKKRFIFLFQAPSARNQRVSVTSRETLNFVSVKKVGMAMVLTAHQMAMTNQITTVTQNRMMDRRTRHETRARDV